MTLQQTIQRVIIELDNEISRLTQARALLNGTGNSNRGGSKRGAMSAEGRKRVADAQRKRWAKARKAAKQ